MFPSLELPVGPWLARNAPNLLRRALGLIFLWFGLLKFCPGLCDVELLAARTMTMISFHALSATACIRFLAVWECVMGVTLLVAPANTRAGRIALQVCAISLVMHLAGTFLPLLLFPADTWKAFPFAPTLAGQYILKNIVLLAAALCVAAQATAQPARLSVLRPQRRDFRRHA